MMNPLISTYEGFENEIQELSLAEFCQLYGISYELSEEEAQNNQLFIERFTEEIESQGLSYTYASYNPADIFNLFQEEPSLDPQKHQLIQINQLLNIAIPHAY